LKIKDRLRDFLRGEAEKILKPSHLEKFQDDTMSPDKTSHSKGANSWKSEQQKGHKTSRNLAGLHFGFGASV
jgi:hypothetical protein